MAVTFRHVSELIGMQKRAVTPLSGAVAPRAPRGGRRRTATLALLAFANLIGALDQYIVVVALPEVGRDLGYSAQSLQSVISAYAVASGGFLLLGGRAADLLGRRRVFVRPRPGPEVRLGLAGHPRERGGGRVPARRARGDRGA
jgi:hypothetical protein